MKKDYEIFASSNRRAVKLAILFLKEVNRSGASLNISNVLLFFHECLNKAISDKKYADECLEEIIDE